MVWMSKCEEIFVKIVKEMERQGIMKILSFINFFYIYPFIFCAVEPDSVDLEMNTSE